MVHSAMTASIARPALRYPFVRVRRHAAMSAAEQPPRRLHLVGEGDFTLALSLQHNSKRSNHRHRFRHPCRLDKKIPRRAGDAAKLLRNNGAWCNTASTRARYKARSTRCTSATHIWV